MKERIAGLVLALVFVLGLAGPAAASTSPEDAGVDDAGAVAAASLVVDATSTETVYVNEEGEVYLTVAPASGKRTYTRVCLPKKCVTVLSSKYCPVTQKGCGKYKYVKAAASAYCAPSTGCVTINGVKYWVVGGPPTPKQQQAILACVASLGVGVGSIIAGGPNPWSIAGIGTTIWGCSTI